MGKKRRKYLIILSVILIFISSLSFGQDEEGSEQDAVYKPVILYVFLDSRDNYQIGMMDPNGENKIILTKKGNNWCPAESKDGSKIAFFSDRSGFSNLWIMQSDGTGTRQLTHNKENIVKIDLYNRGQLAWDNNGKEILFIKKGDIYRIDDTGETPNAVTRFHDVTSFRLSPDGTKILFSREKTKRHNGLWTMDIKGTNLRQITQSTIVIPSFDWGSNNRICYFHNRGFSTISYYGIDRKFIKETYYMNNEVMWNRINDKPGKIAYISDERNGPNIWIMNELGTEEMQVTSKGGFSPYWFPDGKDILYVEENDIYRANLKTKEKIRLTYYFSSYYPVYTEIKVSGGEEAGSAGNNEKK